MSFGCNLEGSRDCCKSLLKVQEEKCCNLLLTVQEEESKRHKTLNESVFLHTNVAEDKKSTTIGKVQAQVTSPLKMYILAMWLFALVLLFVRRRLHGPTNKRAKSI